MHSSGKTIVLVTGNYQAKIVSVGAGIAELTHQGRHLVVPHKPEEMPLAHMGKVLVPWPNRVANGCYHHDGIEFKLPINDHESNAAIHGFLAWRDWQVTEQTDSTVTLTAYLPPSYGYPFMLVSTVSYQLDAEVGLTADIATKNIGDKPAPYGVGVHPYLTCNLDKVDNYRLTIPANQVFEADKQLSPSHFFIAEQFGLNFLTAKQIGAIRIDHTFKTAIPETMAEWEVIITSQQQNMAVYLRSEQPWLQVYTGDKLNRLGLAVEPMSCPPNAFNSLIDLISLAPDESHHLFFAIGIK